MRTSMLSFHRKAHDPVVERPVEEALQLALDAGPLDVAGDLRIERPGVLGGEHQRRPVEPAPPQMAREVEDLGARRLRHLDVPGPADPGDLGDHGRRVGHVLEHVRAHDVVEHTVGERHVGGVGGEQWPGDPGGRATGPLPAVLGADVPVEQHVGPPMRLVAAADIEDEGVGADRDGDPAAVERAEPASQLGHRSGSWQMASGARGLAGCPTVPGTVAPSSGMASERTALRGRGRIAAFDVDGTLTTATAWCRSCAGSPGPVDWSPVSARRVA